MAGARLLDRAAGFDQVILGGQFLDLRFAELCQTGARLFARQPQRGKLIGHGLLAEESIDLLERHRCAARFDRFDRRRHDRR